MKFKILLAFILSMNLFSQEKKDALKLYKEKNFDEAIEITKKEIEASPNKVDSYVVLGWSLLSIKKYDEAVEWMNKIMNFNSTDVRILDILGEANYFLGNYSESIDYFERYLKLDTNKFKSMSMNTYYHLGLSYMKKNDLAKALICLISADSYKTEKDVDLLLKIAYLFEKTNQKSQALKYYQQIMSINPSVKEAQYGAIRLGS